MIVVNVAQHTDAWIRARLGVVTASGAKSLLTPGTLKPSAQAKAYMARLVAETLTGEPIEEQGSDVMDRGTGMEPEAREWYSRKKGVVVDEVGFITDDAGRIGCSPDGIIGGYVSDEFTGLEIKCPLAHNHVAYAMDPDTLVEKYKAQVQFSLFVTGFASWDLLAYNPVLDPVLVTVAPDPAYVAALKPVLEKFLADMDATLAKMRPTFNAKAIVRQNTISTRDDYESFP